jgi:hypothetical protein
MWKYCVPIPTTRRAWDNLVLGGAHHRRKENPRVCIKEFFFCHKRGSQFVAWDLFIRRACMHYASWGDWSEMWREEERRGCHCQICKGRKTRLENRQIPCLQSESDRGGWPKDLSGIMGLFLLLSHVCFISSSCDWPSTPLCRPSALSPCRSTSSVHRRASHHPDLLYSCHWR